MKDIFKIVGSLLGSSVLAGGSISLAGATKNQIIAAAVTGAVTGLINLFVHPPAAK